MQDGSKTSNRKFSEAFRLAGLMVSKIQVVFSSHPFVSLKKKNTQKNKNQSIKGSNAI